MARAAIGQELKLLFKKAKKRDFLSLGRLLSVVESDLKGAALFLASLNAEQKGLRLGITGPPGAGKSSLLNLLLEEYRKQKFSVAVLAVDPSSPISGGALLGDRLRMDHHFADAGVFIRSVGARGGFGGLSVATGAMVTVLEACGFDLVIVETVGVGQTELQIMNLVDATAVVLVPESGDVIQTMKAGILEMADLLVVNKFDRPGASIMVHELQSLVEQDAAKRPVMATSVLEKTGIAEFSLALLKEARALKKWRRKSPERLRGELRNLVLWTADQKFQKKFSALKIENVYRSFSKFKA
jgi:LAO/AO transport system kinase